MNFYRLKKYFADIATVLVVAIMIAASPISHTDILKPQKVEAAFTFTEEVPGPAFFAEIKTAIESTISAIAEVEQSVLAWLGFTQESILDGLFWSLVNSIISNMIQSVTDWVNSGFNGSPAFITNMQAFLRDAVDEAVGGYIESLGGGFLCSPFTVDIQIALEIQYYAPQNRTSQCTLTEIVGNIESFLSGTFIEGGWAGWFELTQRAHNDPNRSFLEARAEMRDIAIRTRDETREIAIGKKFFKDVQICEEGVSFDGSIKNCTVTTPGNIVETQLNNVLDSGRQRIVVADEINELIGAVLSQFTQTIITGIGGLLGAGGNSAYAYRGPGGTGQTLTEQLAAEAAEASGANGDEVFENALNELITHRAILEDVIDFVDDRETEVELAAARHPTCFNQPPRARITAPLNKFTDAKEDALAGLIEIETLTAEVLQYQLDFENASTTEEQIAIIQEFQTVQASGILTRSLTSATLEVELEIRFPEIADDLSQAITAETNRCRNLVAERNNPQDNSR